MNLRTWLTAALIVLAPLVAADTAAAQSHKRCKDVILYQNGSVYTRTHGLWAKRETCKQARRVARKYLTGAEGNAGPAPRPYGYRCQGGQDGVSCTKGRRHVTWGYYDD